MYTAAEYIEIMIVFGESGRNAYEAAKIYAARFPDPYHLDHKLILKVIREGKKTAKRFQTKGILVDVKVMCVQ